MVPFLLLPFLALATVTIAVADIPVVPIPGADETTFDAVVEISYSEISRVYRGDWLLIVYAPWCGHCQSLMNHMPDIVKSLHGSVKIAKIDGTEYDAVRFQFGVDGYPSIYRLHDGEVRTYSGTYSARDIAEFAKTEWMSVAPLTGWASPTSLLVRIASSYINFVTPIVTITENAGKRFDVAPEVIAIAASSCVVLVAIVIAYFCVKKLKIKIMKQNKIKEN